MRGVFIYYKKIDYDNLSGIDKKVINQVNAMRHSGLECELYYMNNELNNRFDRAIRKIKAILPYGNTMPAWQEDNELYNVDFIYFRRPSAINYHMIKVLNNIKKKNPTVKIVMEVPTFPYDKEYLVKPSLIPLLMKDLYNRKKLKSVVDRIAIQNNLDEVFGIKTLHFTNGINVAKINPRMPYERNDDSINICAVASLEPWDGYERIIKGLKNFMLRSDRKIAIHIVGDGSEKKRYESLTRKLKLTNNVIFYGRLTGSALDEIYNKSDLALDVFGMYKKNNNVATSLKSREYLAKGIPMIIGCEVDVISNDFPFHLKFPNNSEVIDFNKIVNFYDEIYKNKCRNDIISEIHNYSYSVCDISNSMNTITEYINKNSN